MRTAWPCPFVCWAAVSDRLTSSKLSTDSSQMILGAAQFVDIVLGQYLTPVMKGPKVAHKRPDEKKLEAIDPLVVGEPPHSTRSVFAYPISAVAQPHPLPVELQSVRGLIVSRLNPSQGRAP